MPRNLDVHDNVVEVLFDLCKEYKTPKGKNYYSSIFPHKIGQNYKPIILTGHITQHEPFAKNYYPDIWAQVSRKQQYDIYEVWHTETEAEAVEDIVFSSLVKGLRYMTIVCTGENLTSDDAEELVYLIIKDSASEKGIPIEDMGFTWRDLPSILRSSKPAMKKYLKEELEF